MRTCYSIPPPSPDSGTLTNPTFAFVNGTHCLFSNGGPQLFIFATGHSSSSSPTSSVDPAHHEWQLELTIPVSPSDDGAGDENPIMIVIATIPESKLYVEVLVAELCDPSAIQHVRSSTSTDSSVATFKWLRLTPVTTGEAVAADSAEQQSGDSMEVAPTLSFKDAQVSTMVSFQCQAFPLYATIVGKNIFFVSEAKPPLSEDADFRVDPDEEGERNDQQGEEHHGLGYDNLGYKWSQSDSDVTVTLELPETVTKADLECEIESNEVVLGLRDGTTYLRGKLHAPIDPEASAWTLEKNM